MSIFFLLLLGGILAHGLPNDFQTICQAGIRQDNTNYIHCARKQLTEIPHFTRITNTFYDELALNDNQIVDIPDNCFRGLRVKRLNLAGNRIRSISPRAFLELANYLEELTIEFDPKYIDQIPDAIRVNLINLRSLKLVHLNLLKLDDRTFTNYRKLEQLSIVKSSIKEIQPNAFRSLTNLRLLSLDQNQLNDSSSFDLPSLEVLVLSQNRFHSIKQENFLRLKSLKVLDLSSNGLQTLDSNSFQSTLEKLYLQNNELNSLQLTFLFSLKNLKELNLDFNRLTFLPARIFQSNKHLTYLSLQGNDLNSLTNQSLFGLTQLVHLNLARNRLQFTGDHQPFQHVNSLKILNLDRNLQLNLSRMNFFGLGATLNELSLQNCHLSSIDHALDSLFHLQRVKLSSNRLTALSAYSLVNSRHSLVSIDLQRNHFTSVPDLFANASKLVDLDLSGNRISTVNEHDLANYPTLKTIGLTGNPLHCDCHLRWIKRWLMENYDHDLIKFLQWTCAKPTHLLGRQLTTIEEQDMACEEEGTTTASITVKSSTSLVSASVSPVDVRRTSTELAPPLNELIINDIVLLMNHILIISWESTSSRLPKYYHVQIYDEHHRHLFFQRLIDGRQRSLQVDTTDYLPALSAVYSICLNTRRQKYCRNLLLSFNASRQSQFASLTGSANQQFIYLLGGILLGATLICSLLIIVCCWRLRHFTKQSLPPLSSMNFLEKSPKTFYYYPLNLLSCPPQSTSSNTSECSLHSSTDTSHCATDPYHIYQQIPSVQNCQLHSTRTQILI